jgi:exonuclease III
MNVLKISTLNINGLHTRARKEMLHDFLRKQEIDILYLQEVVHPNLGELQGYTMYVSVGTEMRGTAFVTRHDKTRQHKQTSVRPRDDRGI